MLLGIGLHGVLSFTTFAPFGWSAVDRTEWAGFDIFFLAVHGFRMPLFFLLSGYFTAMLWRNRGLASLLGHRAKRILLPLALGWLLIVPIIEMASEDARKTRGVRAARQSETELQADLEAEPPAVGDDGTDLDKAASPTRLVDAAIDGDIATVRSLLEDGSDPDTRDEKFVTALHYAAALGYVEVTGALLDAGADVERGDEKNSTPLIWAVLFGQPGTTIRLLEGGADPNARNSDGSSSMDIAMAPWADLAEFVPFVAGLLELEVDIERVERDREELPELLREAGANEESGEGLMAFLFFLPVFHHLWFLWFLCWLVLAFTIHASLARLIGRTLLPAWLFSSPICLLWLVPLTMLPQAFMHGGPESPGFGPDTSIGILPFPHLLFYYGIFFGFGALLFDRPRAAERIGSGWWAALPLALLIMLPYGLAISGTTGEVPGWLPFSTPGSGGRAFMNILAQALYTWLMSLGLVGLFRRILRREHRVVRYLSDSSYWLYLAHLPLIIWLQGRIADWDLPAIPKCLLLCVSVTALLLLTYEYGVRYTPIGTILNGRKVRPGPGAYDAGGRDRHGR